MGNRGAVLPGPVADARIGGFLAIITHLTYARVPRCIYPRSIFGIVAAAMYSEAAALREVYGPCAAKKIARDFGVAVITAKTWLNGRVPPARAEELRRQILARLDERDRLSAEIRREWLGGRAREMAVAEDRRLAFEDRATADRLVGELT